MDDATRDLLLASLERWDAAVSKDETEHARYFPTPTNGIEEKQLTGRGIVYLRKLLAESRAAEDAHNELLNYVYGE